MANLIDACASFIETKNCFYLAKEGCIVYYDSITGRQSDYDWHRFSVSEAMRTIKALKLTSEQARKLHESDLIAAFQELDRVYEFGVKSRHKVREGVFNYYEHCETSLSDMIFTELFAEMQRRSIYVVSKAQIVWIAEYAHKGLDCKISSSDLNDILLRYCAKEGYEVKAGVHRIMIRNKKTTALVKEGYKPSDSVVLGVTEASDIEKKIIKAVR